MLEERDTVGALMQTAWLNKRNLHNSSPDKQHKCQIHATMGCWICYSIESDDADAVCEYRRRAGSLQVISSLHPTTRFSDLASAQAVASPCFPTGLEPSLVFDSSRSSTRDLEQYHHFHRSTREEFHYPRLLPRVA